MKYFEKRPAIEAIQFTGLKNVQDIKFLCRASKIRYEDGPGGCKLWIEFEGNECLNLVLRRGDYAVLDRGRAIVMSEEEFESKYELAGPALNTLTGANLKVNDDGTITGIRIGVPNTTAIRG